MIRTGRLGACETITEEPRNRGFASAAKSLAREFTFTADPGLFPHEQLVVNLPFDFRDPHQAAPPLQIYDPMWVAQPQGGQELFPAVAAKAGIRSGNAMLNCRVAHDGSLQDCTVESETPPGLGFGETALALTHVMAMNPWTQQGTPVDGARIRMPLTLQLPDDEPVDAAPAAPTNRPTPP